MFRKFLIIIFGLALIAAAGWFYWYYIGDGKAPLNRQAGHNQAGHSRDSENAQTTAPKKQRLKRRPMSAILTYSP